MAAPRRTIDRARRLRREATLPERLLWSRIRRLSFRRQHPFGAYTLDFFHRPAKLCIEIDGWGHDMGDQPERDRRRDAWLASQGVEVVRIAAADVLRDLDGVAHGVTLKLNASPWARALGEGDRA